MLTREIALPREMWSEIASFLSNYQDVANLSQANKTLLRGLKLVMLQRGLARLAIDQMVAKDIQVPGCNDIFFLDNFGKVWQLNHWLTRPVLRTEFPKIQKIVGTQNENFDNQTIYFLAENHQVWSFNHSTNGASGIGEVGVSDIFKLSPTQIPYFAEVKEIAAGSNCALFLDTMGSVWSCGSNHFGQIGLGQIMRVFSPTRIATLPPVKHIICGFRNSFFIDELDQVWACGANYSYLPLGVGLHSKRVAEPVLIQGLPPIQSVFVQRQIYFLTHEGDVWISGAVRDLNFRALGVEDESNRPIHLTALQHIVKIIVGSELVFFLDKAGEVWGSGYNIYDNLGLDTAKTDTIVQIPSLKKIKNIIHNRFNTFFVNNDDQVFACGYLTAITTNSRIPQMIPLSIRQIISDGECALWLDQWGRLNKVGKGKLTHGISAPINLLDVYRVKALAKSGMSLDQIIELAWSHQPPFQIFYPALLALLRVQPSSVRLYCLVKLAEKKSEKEMSSLSSVLFGGESTPINNQPTVRDQPSLQLAKTIMDLYCYLASNQNTLVYPKEQQTRRLDFMELIVLLVKKNLTMQEIQNYIAQSEKQLTGQSYTLFSHHKNVSNSKHYQILRENVFTTLEKHPTLLPYLQKITRFFLSALEAQTEGFPAKLKALVSSAPYFATPTL